MHKKTLLITVSILIAVASLWGKSNYGEKTSMPEWLEGSEPVGDITAVNTPNEGGLEGGADSGDVNIGIANGGVTTAKIADEGSTGQLLTSTGGAGVEWQTPSNSADAWLLSGNSGTDPASDYLGTSDNQPLIIKVNNSRVFRLEPHSTCPNIIGGLSTNTVASGLYGVTIGGGGESGTDNNNRATGSYANYATIGGGRGNVVSEGAATIAGGYFNTASGNSSTVAGGDVNTAGGVSATVAGGSDNDATGDWATIGGGTGNTANSSGTTVSGGDGNNAGANYATIGGGTDNTASGICSTIPGGSGNEATGNYSFAAGRYAEANANGVFVWSDATSGVSCNVENRWLAKCSGGVYFYTNSNMTSGSYLAAGGSSWSSVSDRDLKENFEEVDGQEVLNKLARIPVTTWNYKAQEQSIRHIGPMAQDFYSAFGVGEDDKHVTTVDVDGVALAAIKALYEQNQKKDDEIKELRTQLDYLETKINALEDSK